MRAAARRAAARRAEEVRVEEAKERRWDEENKKRENDGKEKISKEDWEKAEDAEKKTKGKALERLMAAAATAARTKYAEVRAREGAAADHATASQEAQEAAAEVGKHAKVHVDRDEEKNDQRVWLRRIIDALCHTAGEGGATVTADYCETDTQRITALRRQYATPRAANPLNYSLRAAAINLMGHFDEEFDKAIKEWTESYPTMRSNKDLYDVDKKDHEKNLQERARFVKDVMNSITPHETEKKDAVVVSPKEPDKARKEFLDAITKTFGKFPLSREEAKLEAKDVVTSIVKKIDIEYQDDIQDMAIEILKKLEPNGLDEYKNVIKDQLDKVNDNIKKKVFSNICKTLETCDVDSIQQARDFKQEKKIIDKMEEAKNKTSKEIKQRNEIKDKINVLEKEKEELESKKQKLEEEPNPSPGIKEEEEINKTISEKTKNLAKSKADKIKIENRSKKILRRQLV